MTRARKKHEFLILFNKRPNPVCMLVDAETDQSIGVRLECFPNEYASSPTSFLTTDQGGTFYQVLSEMSPSETYVQTGNEETDPEILDSLRGLFAAWRESFQSAH
jgi:hypothetical protein